MTTTFSTNGITFNDATTCSSGFVYSTPVDYPLNNVLITWAHGLGVRPRHWGAALVLKIDTNGVPAGTAFAFSSYDGDAGRQNSLAVSDTNLTYIGSNCIFRGFNGSNITMTPTNAQIYFWVKK